MATQNVILPKGYEDWVTVSEATKLLGYKQSGYVRTLIKKGRLSAKKMQVGNKLIWYIDPKSIQHYNDTKGVFAAPTEFRRCTFRFRPEFLELDQALQALTNVFGDPGENWTLEFSHKPSTGSASRLSGDIVAMIVEEVSTDDDDWLDDTDED